jgi:hypothetical protein
VSEGTGFNISDTTFVSRTTIQNLAARDPSRAAKFPIQRHPGGRRVLESIPRDSWNASVPHQALAPSERRPRAESIRVANTYFEGIEAGTDKNTPFDLDCQRIENEVITSNDPSS